MYRRLTIILAPVFMPYTAHSSLYNAVIHVEPPATAVTIRDLTVDGANRGRLDTRFTGIDRDSAGETFEFDPSMAAIMATSTPTPPVYSITASTGFCS